jgi:hypothetical protein
MKTRKWGTATLSGRLWLRLGRSISAATIFFASLLLRLLAILFDLEIRLISLIQKRQEHRSAKQLTDAGMLGETSAGPASR